LHNVYFASSGRNFTPYWPGTEGEFSDALRMNKEEYRLAKLAYRLGGMKRCMPIFAADYVKEGTNAVKLEIQYLRSQGIQVWICTTRPWLSLTTVDPDTQYWLHHNVGKVDGLIYGEDKYADLIDIVGKERILGVVDDLPENVIRAKQLGLKSAIRWGRHNEWWPGLKEWTDSFSRIKDMSSIVDLWMEQHNG
jgi:hypothetical protein